LYPAEASFRPITYLARCRLHRFLPVAGESLATRKAA
jgi:hypothetical protein